MNSSDLNNLVILAVLDGWGISAPGPGNAISLANCPNITKYWSAYPHTQLSASGEAVGLPRDEAGNTETGHLNLGAGRIVYQDLARINMSIADGSFFKNKELIAAINHAKTNNSKLHLMGLIGAGGVHSNMEHLFALMELAKMENAKQVFLHLFTDGRDSPPSSAKTYIAKVIEEIGKEGVGQIASIMGRYWAMDRDQRWDRTQRAYFALTAGNGIYVKTPEEAIDKSYEKGATDEFIEPSLILGADSKPIGVVTKGDAVIFFNFRIDRPRQLSRAFVFNDFNQANTGFGFDPYLVKYQKKHTEETASPVLQTPFPRGPKISNLFFVTMTEYEKPLYKNGAKVAFPPEKVSMSLGRVISEAGLRQIRAAESEKERFVTFYFSGLQEIFFEGEERLIVPSPKVPTYDLKPEMSASQLTTDFLEKIKVGGDYSFALINFANADMVGHTGNIGAAVRACEVVDECIAKIARWIVSFGGTLIITADHGNAEEMINNQTGQIDTEHNKNPVPFIAISQKLIGTAQALQAGILADVAPTILKILRLPVPDTMTGRNLLEGIWRV